MGLTDNNTNIETELQEKLKATSLSESEIKEIIPEILKLTNEIKEDVENNQTESTTKNFLLDLRQDVTNNSNVSIDIKRNKWTIIWTIELNNITNNIYVINKPEAQSTSQSTSQSASQPEVQSTSQTTSQLDQKNLKLDSYEWYDKALSQLIFEIEWCTSTAKYKRWLNKSWKETLKTAKAKLKQYKDIISDKKRMLEHEIKQKNKLNKKNPDKAPLTVSISASEIEELKNKRFQWRQQIEFDIKEWQMWKSSNTAPWPNQSIEQVKKWNKVDHHHIEYNSKLNAALNDTDFLKRIDNNQNRAREFIQAIANNSLSDNQITICQMRRLQLDPYFEKYGLTDQVHRGIQTRGWRYTQSVDNYWNIDWQTAYKTWWVLGWLNNTLIKAFPNAKPQQVSSLTNVAVAAGWIYAIYRIWKWFFGKNEKWERNLWWKAAGLAWIYFVPQLLLWKDWFSLLWEIISWKADYGELWYRASNCLRFLKNGSPEVYEQMAPGVLWMTIFPQNYTVRDVKSLQQTFSDQNSRRQWYTATYDRLNKDNSALANEFKNTFNANQYNENERKAFLAKLWITENTGNDIVIFNEAVKLTDKKTSFELWMKSQWKKRNPEYKGEIDDYLKQEWEFDPNQLKENWFILDKDTNLKNKKTSFESWMKSQWKKRNPIFKKEIDDYLKQEWEFDPNQLKENWFLPDNEATFTDGEEDRQNIKALENQVESLSIPDSQKKSEIKTAIVRFYNERKKGIKPNPDNFSLKMENGYLILASHNWQKAKIDINQKKIKGFWNWIEFSDFAELFNVADLSNKIVETQRWKKPKNNPPFQYKWPTTVLENWIGKMWRWIYFNDAEGLSLSFNFDTRVLSGGRGWEIWKIDTLSNHEEDFANYLSKRWLEANEVNLSRYPLTKQLRNENLIFIDEAEVKNVEVLLQNIKTSFWSVYSDQVEPFKLWFFIPNPLSRNTLTFTRLEGETQKINIDNFEEKYPTLINNKEIFLNFLNNPNNWMFKKRTW